MMLRTAMGRYAQRRFPRASTVAATFLSNPVVVGTPTENQTSTATAGAADGTEPITHAYQWQKNTVDIGGATSLTSPTWVLADVGASVRLKQTATNSGNAPVIAYSAAKVVQAAPGAPGTLTAFWNASEDLTVTGYRLYYSTTDNGPLPPVGASTADASGRTTVTVSVNGVSPGIYYLWLASYDGTNYSAPYQLEPETVA